MKKNCINKEFENELLEAMYEIEGCEVEAGKAANIYIEMYGDVSEGNKGDFREMVLSAIAVKTIRDLIETYGSVFKKEYAIPQILSTAQWWLR